MSNAIVLFVSLLVIWVVLSGFFNAFFIGLGVLSCLIATFVTQLISRQMGASAPVMPIMFRLPSYLAWLEWEIIKSSLDVAVKMWQLEPEIDPAVAWVSTAQKNEVGVAMFATSITLTPGTVSVMVRDDLIQVHALHKDGLEALREGPMDKKVLAVAA